MVSGVVIVFTTSCLEGGVEDFDSVLVRNHATFDSKLDELSDVHSTILNENKTWVKGMEK